MNIVWMSWKDLSHPQAGGAEVVTDALCSRLAQDGHSVTLLTSAVEGKPESEEYNGYTVKRMGGRLSVYMKVASYFKRHYRGSTDVVVEEVNTIPFFAQFYVKTKSIMFYHMLCREIWYYQMPMPISFIGEIIEPIYTWILSRAKVITVSNSTKNDLMKFGFKSERINIISEGINLEPIHDIEDIIKYEIPTVLSFGSIRPMKRTLDQVQAFELAKATVPDLQLIIAGNDQGAYADRIKSYISKSEYRDSIVLLGSVDTDKKMELMQRSHTLLVTSIKEGWGLTVTEANSQGTPAIVYDVDGLRDSVKDEETGYITKGDPESMASAINRLFKFEITNTGSYNILRASALKWSRTITFANAYEDFKKIVGVS